MAFLQFIIKQFHIHLAEDPQFIRWFGESDFMKFHHSHWVPMPRECRDKVAAILSIIPGLGHAYKGHWTLGVVLCVLGVPVSIFAGLLMAPTTLGLGLLIPLAYWVGVGLSAWSAEDLHEE